MREELESSRLDVCLIPSPVLYQPTQKKKRIVMDRNPSWYRQFCAEYQSRRTRPRRKRHGDTMIKRQHTLRALGELADGQCETEYAHRLVEFVKQYATEFMAAHMRGE